MFMKEPLTSGVTFITIRAKENEGDSRAKN